MLDWKYVCKTATVKLFEIYSCQNHCIRGLILNTTAGSIVTTSWNLSNKCVLDLYVWLDSDEKRSVFKLGNQNWNGFYHRIEI